MRFSWFPASRIATAASRFAVANQLVMMHVTPVVIQLVVASASALATAESAAALMVATAALATRTLSSVSVTELL